MRQTGNGTPSERVVTSRRTVILASGTVLAGVAACGGDDDSTSDNPDEPGQNGDAADQSENSAQPDETTAEDPTSEPAGDVIGNASDVPVGGGTVFAEQQIVVVQPDEGEFKAFTAVCTHQGCIVDSVADGEILCPCHGSRYSAADGSVLQGPATQPLAEEQVTVDGEAIVIS